MGFWGCAVPGDSTNNLNLQGVIYLLWKLKEFLYEILTKKYNPTIITHFWGKPNPNQWESKHIDLSKQSAQSTIIK